MVNRKKHRKKDEEQKQQSVQEEPKEAQKQPNNNLKELLGAATGFVRSVRYQRKSLDEDDDFKTGGTDSDSDDKSLGQAEEIKESENYLEFYETLQNTFQQKKAPPLIKFQPKKDPPFFKHTTMKLSSSMNPINDDELVSYNFMISDRLIKRITRRVNWLKP